MAFSTEDLPNTRPQEHVIDSAAVLSRSSRNTVEQKLAQLGAIGIDGRLVTFRGLDYGQSLNGFGYELLEKWSEGEQSDNAPLLIFLIESQNNQASLVASEQLDFELPEEVLASTAKSTMGKQIREENRYRQAVLDGIERVSIVISGAEDPGPPEELNSNVLTASFPSEDETLQSNALTWVIILLAVGTIVPMATWWVFSR